MKRLLFACASLLVLSLTAIPVRAETYGGSWSADAALQSGTVHLRVEYRHATAFGDDEWDESSDVPLANLRGLAASDFQSSGQHKSFAIVRDAGEFRADGWFANGHASGAWTFAPNAAFASELSRRGVGAPSERQQFELAMGDFKLSMLDELQADGFERPSIDDLVAMMQHGVNERYIAGVKNVPVHPKTVQELIRMRDHGVSAEYAARMMAYVPAASADDLVRMRDHGVTASFVERMRAHGYRHLSVDDLIRLRDHGF